MKFSIFTPLDKNRALTLPGNLVALSRRIIDIEKRVSGMKYGMEWADESSWDVELVSVPVNTLPSDSFPLPLTFGFYGGGRLFSPRLLSFSSTTLPARQPAVGIGSLMSGLSLCLHTHIYIFPIYDVMMVTGEKVLVSGSCHVVLIVSYFVSYLMSTFQSFSRSPVKKSEFGFGYWYSHRSIYSTVQSLRLLDYKLGKEVFWPSLFPNKSVWEERGKLCICRFSPCPITVWSSSLPILIFLEYKKGESFGFIYMCIYLHILGPLRPCIIV